MARKRSIRMESDPLNVLEKLSAEQYAFRLLKIIEKDSRELHLSSMVIILHILEAAIVLLREEEYRRNGRHSIEIGSKT